MNEVVIDATNALLGRLASYAAKQALLGKNIAIVNCNRIVVSGNQRSVIEHYKILRQRGGHSLNGPLFPRLPERIVKRTIRGMLPYKQTRGLAALKRVKCYNEMPEEYRELKKIKAGKEKNIQTITLKEVSREL